MENLLEKKREVIKRRKRAHLRMSLKRRRCRRCCCRRTPRASAAPSYRRPKRRRTRPPGSLSGRIRRERISIQVAKNGQNRASLYCPRGQSLTEEHGEEKQKRHSGRRRRWRRPPTPSTVHLRRFLLGTASRADCSLLFCTSRCVSRRA